MNESILSRWEMIATNVCRLDNSREAESKYTGLSNLLKTMENEMGEVLKACLPVVTELDFSVYKRYIADWQDRYNDTARKCYYLLTNHLKEVEQWEAEGDEKQAERMEMLKKNQYKYKIDPVLLERRMLKAGLCTKKSETEAEPDPNAIYYANGTYRMFWGLCLTDEYHLLRALQEQNVSSDVLPLWYKSVCLYASLNKEKADVEAVAGNLEVVLQRMAENALNLPQNELDPQSGIIAPQDENKALNAKETFLRYIPTKNHKKAERLLQRVIKGKYCDTNYNWKESRLKLTCFCYVASDYLEIKSFEYTHNKNKFESETRKATNWQAFEALFWYDGKKPDENGKYHQLADVKKQKCRYDAKEFYQCPEMIEIKKLFNT